MNAQAVTALVAEDEAFLARALARQLHQCWPVLQLVASVADGDSAVRETLRLLPDVVFLDIRMPGRTGLEAAEAIASGWPRGRAEPLVVFVTAYDEFAVAAFERAAADYLLKPVTAERLQQCVQRLTLRLDERARLADQARLAGVLQDLALQLGQGLPAAARAAADGTGAALIAGTGPAAAAAVAAGSGARSPRLDVLRAGSGNTVHMIPLDEVLYFEARDKYVAVVTATGESLVRMRLHELAGQLDGDRFVQVHRGVLVSRHCIERATREEDGGWRLRLRGTATELRVSRAFAHHFRPM